MHAIIAGGAMPGTAAAQSACDQPAIDIGGGLGAFQGKAWRIGLMGHGATADSVDRVAAALRAELA